MSKDDGRYFKTAAEANEWLEFDADEEEVEERANEMPDRQAEWVLWMRAAERLDPWPLEQIRRHDQPRHLRYRLVCSIGVVPGAESVTGDAGYTDDLDVALWHAEHSPYPGWEVYDEVQLRHVGSGPPVEYEWRSRIETLIGELTVPGWHRYPYLHLDELGKKRRAEDSADHLNEHPLWRPAPEPIVQALRTALYRAKGIERAAAEADPPGRLAIYSDGRDLEPGWDWKKATP